MEESVELFEFARQIATPEYVAMRSEEAQHLIEGSEIAIAVALCALAVAVALAIIAFFLDRRRNIDPYTLYDIALAIAVIFAIVFVLALFSYIGAVSNAVYWQNDPVTKVAEALMNAIG